jgi:Spy/CpxP family protein refolding chaperone
MKRHTILTFLACGVSVLISTAAQGQSPAPSATPAVSPTEGAGNPGPGPRERFGRRGGVLLERLSEQLQLTDAQKSQIGPIIEQAKPQMKAIEEEAQAKRKALIDSVSSQIKPILNPDQQAKFSDMVQRIESRPEGPGAGPGPNGEFRRGKFGKRGEPPAANTANNAGPAGGGGGQGEVLQRLTTELGLTQDQQNQIKPILDGAHTQIQSIRGDTGMSEDQKLAKIRETMEGVHGQINGILTPAQQQQFAAMKDHFRRNGAGRPGGAPAPSKPAAPSPSPSATGA